MLDGGQRRRGPPLANGDLAWPASQEFKLEKLQLLEQEKSKIRKEYERREAQVEVKKKM